MIKFLLTSHKSMWDSEYW